MSWYLARMPGTRITGLQEGWTVEALWQLLKQRIFPRSSYELFRFWNSMETQYTSSAPRNKVWCILKANAAYITHQSRYLSDRNGATLKTHVVDPQCSETWNVKERTVILTDMKTPISSLMSYALMSNLVIAKPRATSDPKLMVVSYRVIILYNCVWISHIYLTIHIYIYSYIYICILIYIHIYVFFDIYLYMYSIYIHIYV